MFKKSKKLNNRTKQDQYQQKLKEHQDLNKIPSLNLQH